MLNLSAVSFFVLKINALNGLNVVVVDFCVVALVVDAVGGKLPYIFTVLKGFVVFGFCKILLLVLAFSDFGKFIFLLKLLGVTVDVNFEVVETFGDGVGNVYLLNTLGGLVLDKYKSKRLKLLTEVDVETDLLLSDVFENNDIGDGVVLG